jgi:hypothetical protein
LIHFILKDDHNFLYFIFNCRFHESWNLHCNITSYIESKDYDSVIEIGENAFILLKRNLDDSIICSNDQSLPTFLRAYKAGSVLTRVLWLAVDGYQKLKKYQAASDHIHFLLKQNIYLTQYRGRWHERLVINQKQYLKTPLRQRQLTLENALKDQHVLDSHKLNISERLEKLMEEIQRPPKKKSKTTKNDETETERDFVTSTIELFRLHQIVPTRTIEGEKL